MKYYDKEIYKKSEAIKTIFIILFIFLFGFCLGYFISNYESQKIIKEKEDKIINQAIELDSLRETVYIYQMKEKTK